MVEINIFTKDNTTFSGLIQKCNINDAKYKLGWFISISESMVMNILLFENKIPIVLQILSLIHI